MVLLAAALVGCASDSAVKPVEYFDERSALTVGALKEPIELLPGAPSLPQIVGKRISFAYLGPVEWDRSGEIEYGLWIHIAPAGDRQIADIRAFSALTLVIDGVSMELTPMDAPQTGRSPYEPAASWGQTAYFQLDPAALKHMAASQKLELNVRCLDDATLSFTPSGDAQSALTEFLKARSITAD